MDILDHEAIEFKIEFSDRRKITSRILIVRRVDYRLLREVVFKAPWENVFEDAGFYQCGQKLNTTFLEHKSM